MTPALETIPADDFTEDGRLARDGTVAVLFHAQWCGYCAALMPEYEKFTTRHEGTQWALADVSEDEDHRWESQKIKVVPSIVLFRDGKEMARKDGRRGYGLDEKDLAFIAAAARA